MTDHEAKPPFTRETLAAQAMGAVDPATGAVVPPLHLSSTYLRDPDNQYRSGFAYGRADNATVRELESIVAMLEGAPRALVFGSGMSAAVAVFSALEPGARVVAPRVMYWALRNWLSTEAARLGLTVDFVDTLDLAATERALAQPGVRLIWLETPSNPLWGVTDVAAIAQMARLHSVLVAVDSTCASPVLTQPLALGADIVMHSASKYLNGHSDVIAGALALRDDCELLPRIERIRASAGMILGPFEAFLVTRGVRTMHVRVRAACANALRLAEALRAHPSVAEVLYPGLPEHPQHALAARQMQGGFGGMLSIRVKGGEAAAIAAAAHVGLWKRATSLGGVESLIEHRASVEGPTSPCPPDLLRLSCGIESFQDLFDDLDRAFAHAR